MRRIAQGFALLLACVTHSYAQGTPQMPEDQARFISVLEQSRERLANASNNMAKALARTERANAICAVLKNRTVKGWVGKVRVLDVNRKGKGYLTIEIAPFIAFVNATTDGRFSALIEPTSPLFRQAASFEIGQTVIFSGNLYKSQSDCARSANVSSEADVPAPLFLINYTALRGAAASQTGMSAANDKSKFERCVLSNAAMLFSTGEIGYSESIEAGLAECAYAGPDREAVVKATTAKVDASLMETVEALSDLEDRSFTRHVNCLIEKLKAAQARQEKSDAPSHLAALKASRVAFNACSGAAGKHDRSEWEVITAAQMAVMGH